MSLKYILACSQLLAATLVWSAPAFAASRAECDGLPDTALSREAIGSARINLPSNFGSKKHIAMCRKALRDKKIPQNSPRIINLLQAKLFSSLMAGHDLEADEPLLDQAQLGLILKSARTKIAPVPNDPKLQKLLASSPGPESMTEAELDRYDHINRMIVLLRLNRKPVPDQAAIDKSLGKATAALSPFDLYGYRELATIASMTSQLTEAETIIYRHYANLHPSGYLAWVEALHTAGRHREAFNMLNAFSSPYFETDPIKTEAVKIGINASKQDESDDEFEDFGSQMLRIKTAALATDMMVVLTRSTPAERSPWVTRTIKYAEHMFAYVGAGKHKKLQFFDQLPVSQALITATSPLNLLDAGSLYNKSEYTKAQAALKKSQTCGILVRKSCHSWGRAEIARRLLKQDFSEKDAAYLGSVTKAMESPALHRRLYTSFFSGPDEMVKTLLRSPIGRTGGSAKLDDALVDLSKGATEGGAVAPLIFTVLVPRKGQDEAALLKRLWRLAGLVAQRNDKEEVALPRWFGRAAQQDRVLRSIFDQTPATNSHFVAQFALLTADEQLSANQEPARSIGFSRADFNQLGPANAEERELAEQSVIVAVE